MHMHMHMHGAGVKKIEEGRPVACKLGKDRFLRLKHRSKSTLPFFLFDSIVYISLIET